MTLYHVFILLLSMPAIMAGSRLEVSGTDFKFEGKKVFLSGGNLPWINYGYDFGNGQWEKIKRNVSEQMQLLREAGGSTMRLWIHIQAESTPEFNSSGYVIAPDRTGTFMDDFLSMLDLAKNNSIMVVPTLWNAAVGKDEYRRLHGLITNWKKLESYIRVVLKPLVKKVKGHPNLAAWDILNEPEGSLITGHSDINPCFDTTNLTRSGAGWAGRNYSYEQILRFINWHAHSIKSIDPDALVTNGIWNPMAGIDALGMVNHYKDECLIKAGKRELGKLDFYEFHDYSHKGKFDKYSTFKHKFSDYNSSKPIVVGEFWAVNLTHVTDSQLFEHVYLNGYGGAWSWDLVKHGKKQRVGITDIENDKGNGQIDINI